MQPLLQHSSSPGLTGASGAGSCGREGLGMVVEEDIMAVIILYGEARLLEWFLPGNHGFRVQLH